MITAVIPTRNRPADLSKAVDSVMRQTRPPEELLIVDQSLDSQSQELVAAIMNAAAAIKLTYILDSEISGLVEAKHIAANRAEGDIVCFLEDDVVLEPEFLEQILLGFKLNANMMGCCGIITNPPVKPWYHEKIFHFFHRGLFRDKRVGIYGLEHREHLRLIECDWISGGLSAWRREVFFKVPFDRDNGFHMIEDIDFSTRVFKHYRGNLYINPNAKLAHHCSPVNRLSFEARQRLKITEYIVFFRKRKNWSWAYTSLVWLLTGLLLESVVQSLKLQSIRPFVGYCTGTRDGFMKRLVRE